MARTMEWSEEWLTRIKEAVEGLRYGTVQIVVHDGKIVQIDRTERYRYEAGGGKTGSSAPKEQGRKARRIAE